MGLPILLDEKYKKRKKIYRFFRQCWYRDKDL